jgi:hypothetical protein
LSHLISLAYDEINHILGVSKKIKKPIKPRKPEKKIIEKIELKKKTD